MVIERKFVEDSLVKREISRYMERTLLKAGFSRVEIQKTPMITRITAYVMNPGRVIGRGGSTIDSLTETIKKRYHIDNPQISVAEVPNARLEPRLVGRHIADALERGANARSLLHFTIRDVMQNGAMGVEIIATGKLAAKGARAKQIKVRQGYIPKAGDVTRLVSEAHITSYPKYGAIGIKVRIVQPGTKFPQPKPKRMKKTMAEEVAEAAQAQVQAAAAAAAEKSKAAAAQQAEQPKPEAPTQKAADAQ